MTKISTHALREEGDTTQIRAIRPSSVFLPTPSARRATIRNYLTSETCIISTHALREEGDRRSRPGASSSRPFLPTPSARRATQSGVP